MKFADPAADEEGTITIKKEKKPATSDGMPAVTMLELDVTDDNCADVPDKSKG